MLSSWREMDNRQPTTPYTEFADVPLASVYNTISESLTYTTVRSLCLSTSRFEASASTVYHP